MRDKHIHIEKDSLLLKQVYADVEQRLLINKKKTRRLLAMKFIFYFALMAISYTVIFYTNNVFVLFLGFVMFGVLSVLMGFNFAHDLCHNTVFKNNKLNNLGFIAIYTMLGAHAEAWKFRHIRSHHYAPNVKDYDSDLQITHLIRVEPGSDYSWYHKFQHLYAPIAYTTYSFYWVFVKDFVIHFSNDGNPQKRKRVYHVSFWTQKIFYVGYLLILPILFCQFSWMLVTTAFLAMHFVQSLFLLFTFFMTHHVEKTAYFETDDNGYIQTSWLANQIKSSNDFHPFSKTANFIFGGFNNHIAHHLFPHIHHVHYPALNRILYRTLIRNNIRPNVTTFTGGIVSHLRHLRKLSEQ